jgi:hypothetical protein
MARVVLDRRAEALPMRKLILPEFILLGALMSLAACETSQTPTVPTALESNANLSVTAASSVTAQQTTFSFCPVTPPFTATVSVVVVAGSVNVFVTSITSQFTDTNQIQLPTITLPAPVPTAQFGSALVEARRAATFPVIVNFGCGTARTGTIAMTVHLSDANGMGFMRNLNVRVN